MPSRVVILVGCSGSGKSTYALRQFPGAIVVSADHYFERLAKRSRRSYVRVFDTWQLRYAHAECLERFIEALSAGTPIVIVDNTNVAISDRQRYIKRAQEYGIEAELHVLGPWLHGAPEPTPDEIQCYVTACHGRARHGAPFEVISQQLSKLELPSGIYRAGKPPQFLREIPTQARAKKPHLSRTP